MKTIVTIPPYAPFIDEVVRHPAVEGLRLNVVMPVKNSLEDVLKKLDDNAKKYGKDFWVDLKCRQLRVKTFGVPPFTEIELTHNIEVNTPVTAYFSGGREYATVLKVDCNRLIMQEGPKRVVGPGESVNIPDDSLKINGFFTDADLKYIEAMQKNDMHNYMLSFVEKKEDIDELLKLDKAANIIAKIESKKGLGYVNQSDVRLMAARGDLFVELEMPHEVIGACEKIIQKDSSAIAASRIFDSLEDCYEPSCADIGDADNLMRMGYRHFMFGDEICMKRDSIISGLNLFEATSGKYR